MKILFGVRHDGADGYYRAIAPASVLRYNGIETACRGPSFEDADDFDVLVLQRHCSPAAELLVHEFHRKGKKVIYDVDDWLRGIPPYWPAYDTYWNRGKGTPAEQLLFHERIARNADLITCTTWPLAEKMLEYKEQDRIRIVPNCVMWADWDTVIPVERQSPRPVVGWFGLPYYWHSWSQMVDAVEGAVEDVDADLAILGYPEVTHLLSDRILSRTWIEPMTTMRDFGEMRRMIATFDVGIAWVADTPFNRCKSPLRALQYGAAGVPIAASEVTYGGVLSDSYPGEFGKIVPTPDALYHAIVDAVRRPDSARLLADKWRQRVFEHHSYETQWAKWADVIEEVLDLR
jgi:glycosyltransferase involved in cell wall biosynthesis